MRWNDGRTPSWNKPPSTTTPGCASSVLHRPTPPAAPCGYAELVTVAAYRERWSMRGDTLIGRRADVSSIEQLGQYKRASAAVEEALALAHGKGPATTPETRGARVGIEPKEGVEL